MVLDSQRRWSLDLGQDIAHEAIPCRYGHKYTCSGIRVVNVAFWTATLDEAKIGFAANCNRRGPITLTLREAKIDTLQVLNNFPCCYLMQNFLWQGERNSRPTMNFWSLWLFILGSLCASHFDNQISQNNYGNQIGNIDSFDFSHLYTIKGWLC